MKKLVNYSLLVLSMVIHAGIALAQSEASILQPKTAMIEATENQVFIKQVTAIYSLGNQKKLNNNLSITQPKSGSQVYLQQYGFDNQYNGAMLSTDADIRILQIGQSNSVEQSIYGNSVRFEVRQEGDFNQVNYQYGKSSIPLTIRQRGSHMQLIVK